MIVSTVPAVAAPQAATFDFGGTPLSISSENDSWMRHFRDRYESFTVGGPKPSDAELDGSLEQHYQVVYRVEDPANPDPKSLFEARQQPFQVQRNGDSILIEGAAFRAELRCRQRTATISGPNATYPVDALLQVLWYEAFPDGLILHAAALAAADRGWLLCGPSGSGKSTLARLFPELALCDELAGVRLEPTPQVTALPFWGGRRGQYPLSSIYLLEHDDRNHRRRLTARETCERLRRQVIWPTFDPIALDRAFATFFDLLERVSIWCLGFRPESDVWSVISQESP